MDANQAQLVKAARGVGASVWITSALGKGAPDAVLGWQGRNLLVEFKDGSKPPSQRVLTPDEATFYREWRGQIAIVESVEQLYNLLGVRP